MIHTAPPRCLTFTTLIPGEVRFLILSEAALLNLSLLTSDLWAVVFSIFMVAAVPGAAYYGALLLIIAGIVLYEAGPSPTSIPADIDIALRTVQRSGKTAAQDEAKDLVRVEIT